MPDSTVAEIIKTAWGYLYQGTRGPERDKLASGISANATSLTSTYQAPAIKAGAKLNIDLEEFHVWAVSGATVTVAPAENGSTAAAHSAGANIFVNPEFSQFEIFREINNELKALSGAGLFKVSMVTLAYNPSHLMYDLTSVTNVEGILSVVAETSGSDRARVPVPWRLVRNVDTDTFASGFALAVYDGWSGRDVFVTYKDEFTPLSSVGQSVYAISGLPYSAHDVLAMGAALRLAWPAEIGRNQTSAQGSTRRANEVPAGSRVNAPRGLAALYQRRVVQEAGRFKRDYPTRLPKW